MTNITRFGTPGYPRVCIYIYPVKVTLVTVLPRRCCAFGSVKSGVVSFSGDSHEKPKSFIENCCKLLGGWAVGAIDSGDFVSFFSPYQISIHLGDAAEVSSLLFSVYWREWSRVTVYETN